MKRTKRIFSLLCMTAIVSLTHAQAQSGNIPDSTGLPGDNFSLEGAIEMFKKAGSVEEFEKMLNTESNNVNNLDLNNDGEIDYIKVIDKKQGDVHAFVLQDAVSETENQDIAVIELEKTGNDNAVLQIVGDADIYGEETIIEPSGNNSDVSFVNTGRIIQNGPSASFNNEDENNGIIVNVWLWPCVRFVYAPAYVLWVSPWSWHARPIWWHPWRPVHYAVFYPRRVVYRPHYTVVRTNRIIGARTMYRPTRVTSVTVRTRNQVTVNRYRTTRRTTTVVNPGRRNPQVQPRRTTTTTIQRNTNRRPVERRAAPARTTRKVNRRN
ncbi:MAG: hypothetical protein QM802_19595 [Agriterribacter sp.]